MTIELLVLSNTSIRMTYNYITYIAHSSNQNEEQ